MTSNSEFEFDNPRFGGKYRISQDTYQSIQNGQDSELARKMASWIIGKHLSGDPNPLVNNDALGEVKAARVMSFNDRVERLLQLASSQEFQPSDNFRISGIIDAQYKENMANLSNWLDLDERHISDFFRLTGELGITRHANNFVHLTAKGFEKLDELRSTNMMSQQAFVAMWFNSETDKIYDKAIAPAIRAAGYSPMRIDKKMHNNKIDDEIIAEIRRSKFIVADFTCEKRNVEGVPISIPRGGVYFEAGLAMGLGIPVIWTCRSDLIDYVHFDTRQFAHITWETPESLRSDLYNRICATIKELPHAPGLD